MNKEEGFKGTNYTTTNSPLHTAKPQAVSKEQQSDQQLAKTDGASQETSIQAILLTVDSIFTQALEGDALVHFLRALCRVSREEVAHDPPRNFARLKILTFTAHNLNTIRLEWSRIFGEYFSEAGCSSKEDIALSVVDQLSEVSRMFLESGLEMSRNLNFQEFWHPFQHIMMNNTSLCIKNKVVQCVSQLANIAQHHHQFFTSVDLFQDWINCLSEFACNLHTPNISLDALSLINNCVDQVTEKQLTPNMLGDQQRCD
ncbi:hypothetical protein Pmani_018867 [Petrolisthes manimaculis]|uniref:Mon2/Sec7/BIG1-like HDS domain-containing protein n=1 Tax=Petrolisthes manimaculis TaxID=1843537 RepID=A0AAE1U7Y4_9EUCA|nr:hypothetical protein Pmani_018867 [Petrolisthes manimaculis]